MSIVLLVELSVNNARITFSKNQTLALVLLSMMELPCTCTFLAVWWRVTVTLLVRPLLTELSLKKMTVFTLALVLSILPVRS